ncbi:MAG: tetratricopeptide repeat protein [Acidobacteriia bacterium]|nr:tetratricopeptide repeat protein [Terriglobia bacterium]
MPRLNRFTNCLMLALLAPMGSGWAQQAPPKKPPAIIRDTGVAEGKTDAETAVKKEYNPLLAAENLEKGKFYFKRGNYDAAIQRYLDALEYQPNLVAAYDALGRAYEKKGDKSRALAIYKDFLKKYPESPSAADFKSRCARLEKKK